MIRISLAYSFLLSISIIGCKPDPVVDVCKNCDLTGIVYQPAPYTMVKPAGFGEMYSPPDNPMTLDGVALGKKLFFDPILSKDNTISCGSCHFAAAGMTDNEVFSKGVNGTLGTRSSMSLINVGYHYNGLFWDGRDMTLEEQALDPIENPVEMHNTWPEAVNKLIASSEYGPLFRKAFGISNKIEITKELTAKALAQYERSLVSANSRYDALFLSQTEFPTDQELRGYDMFFNHKGNDPSLPDAQCGHCHNGFLLTNNQYANNGLDSFGVLTDYPDRGRGAVTNNYIDNGRFRTPTLRNIGFTAPYMHDGRFKTLEEVMEHYTEHIKKVQNLDPNLVSVKLTESQKQDILHFLKTMDDPSIPNNPHFKAN